MSSGTIHKAVLILRFAVENGLDWRLRDLSSQLKIPRTTVHRICKALADEGFLQLDPKAKQYRWGPQLVNIAQAVYQSSEIRRLVLPVLRRIVAECNETALLVLYDKAKHQVIFTDEISCDHAIRFHTPVGVSVPIYAGASGKSVMAFLPEKEIEKIMTSGLRQLTPRTVTDPNKLMRDLTRIRAKGYAFTHGERTPETVGIACPIFNGIPHVIGALVVSIPAYRFRPEMESRIHKLVRQGADQLSRVMGLPPDISYPPSYELCNKNRGPR